MTTIYQVEPIKEPPSYSLSEVCQSKQLNREFVILCVEYSLADVHSEYEDEWQFSLSTVSRLEKAWRLQRDLNINHEGLSLVLDLLDDIEQQKTEISHLKQKLEHWEKNN